MGGLLVVLIALLLTLPAFAADLPVLPKAKGEACIASAEVMRRDHPDMLKHQRDETLRLGIRGAKASLKACIECHAASDSAGKAVPVNDPGQFCQSCHAYAAVKPDCFECHATTPGPERAQRVTGALSAPERSGGKPSEWNERPATEGRIAFKEASR